MSFKVTVRRYRSRAITCYFTVSEIISKQEFTRHKNNNGRTTSKMKLGWPRKEGEERCLSFTLTVSGESFPAAGWLTITSEGLRVHYTSLETIKYPFLMDKLYLFWRCYYRVRLMF